MRKLDELFVVDLKNLDDIDSLDFDSEEPNKKEEDGSLLEFQNEGLNFYLLNKGREVIFHPSLNSSK